MKALKQELDECLPIQFIHKKQIQNRMDALCQVMAPFHKSLTDILHSLGRKDKEAREVLVLCSPGQCSNVAVEQEKLQHALQDARQKIMTQKSFITTELALVKAALGGVVPNNRCAFLLRMPCLQQSLHTNACTWCRYMQTPCQLNYIIFIKMM